MKGVNLKRLGEEFKAKDIPIALVTSPAGLAYIAGVNLNDEETLKWSAGVRNVAVITQSGEATLIIQDSSEHQAKRDSWIPDKRTYAWRPGNVIIPFINDALKEKTSAPGKIGVELAYLPVEFYQSLTKAFPSATLEDCTDAIARARSIKTPEELNVMRKGVAATERALVAAFIASHSGNTERDVARRFTENIFNQGADKIEHVWMYGGDRTTDKFRPPGDKRLGSGELLRVDVGAIFKGYNSDIARMAIVGKPNENQKRIYDGLREAHLKMIECVRPGIPAGKLIQAFGEECKKHGLPFSGRGLLSHGLGLVVHDYPVIYEATDPSPLEAGMVLAIEPYVVVGTEKYAIEDDVLVTEIGAEVLSTYLQHEEMWQIAD